MKKYTLLFLAFIIVAIGVYAIIPQIQSQKNTQNSSLEIPQFKTGDIIFQSSQSRQCTAVQLATKSMYSHVGLIYNTEGNIMVYEAVQPVKITPFKEWIKRGKDNHYVVKRLKNADSVLNDSTILLLKTEGEKYLGKNYDLYFNWSNDKIYCSELVWKMYKNALGIEVGKLQKLKDFDLSSDIVKTILKERYGNNIPLEEIVISPEAIFQSSNLDLIYSE